MFVVYDKETTRIFKEVATERAAKMARTRNKLNDTHDIAKYGDFKDNIEKWVSRFNLQSGKPFQEPINTPPYMSPAFESYWSM